MDSIIHKIDLKAPSKPYISKHRHIPCWLVSAPSFYLPGWLDYLSLPDQTVATAAEYDISCVLNILSLHAYSGWIQNWPPSWCAWSITQYPRSSMLMNGFGDDKSFCANSCCISNILTALIYALLSIPPVHSSRLTVQPHNCSAIPPLPTQPQ